MPAVEPTSLLEFGSRGREEIDEQIRSCLGIRFTPGNSSAKGAHAGLRHPRWALMDSRRLTTCNGEQDSHDLIDG